MSNLSQIRIVEQVLERDTEEQDNTLEQNEEHINILEQNEEQSNILEENEEQGNHFQVQGDTNSNTLRRSIRSIRPPQRLQDFVTYHATTYPIENYMSYNNISSNYCAYLSSISNQNEPSNYQEAIENPLWKKAMEEELRALEKNKTWTIVKLPLDKKPVGCK